MAITVSQNANKYSFDSVGELEVDTPDNALTEAASAPIGIKTPMSLDYQSGDFFTMHRDLAKQIRDNFKNLLQTNKGERLMLGDFGANLEPLAFELTSENGVRAAQSRIKSATQKYMPYINLLTFEPLIDNTPDRGGLAKVGVNIGYSVPTAGIFDQEIEVIIYSAG